MGGQRTRGYFDFFPVRHAPARAAGPFFPDVALGQRVSKRCGPETTRAEVRITEVGGPDRDQTDDLVVANDALYQLSYRPVREVRFWENAVRK